MPKETRTFAFNLAQFRYLIEHSLIPQEMSDSVAVMTENRLVLTRQQRDFILDRVSDRLLLGFDVDWKPNPEGLLIESIIDVLTDLDDT